MSSRAGAHPSWYLDPLVAAQKRHVYQQWIRGSEAAARACTVLKTDLFEEAYGDDRILDDVLPEAARVIGMDWNSQTAEAAARRGGAAYRAVVCDVRSLPFPAGSLDAAISNSTLDHFEEGESIHTALDELTRVLRPGGALLISFDNPHNPTYHLLRWFSRTRFSPFSLGRTVGLTELKQMLLTRGFHIEQTEYLIHNPRGFSTALFLALRKLLGRFADAPIRACLKLFAALGQLPSRRFTGCFLAVRAVKQIAAPAGQTVTLPAGGR